MQVIFDKTVFGVLLLQLEKDLLLGTENGEIGLEHVCRPGKVKTSFVADAASRVGSSTTSRLPCCCPGSGCSLRHLRG